jgi:hypothetical protein
LRLREQIGQRLGSYAMAPRVSRIAPSRSIDARELRRIEIEPLAIAAQRARRFVDLDARRLEQTR